MPLNRTRSNSPCASVVRRDRENAGHGQGRFERAISLNDALRANTPRHAPLPHGTDDHRETEKPRTGERLLLGKVGNRTTVRPIARVVTCIGDRGTAGTTRGGTSSASTTRTASSAGTSRSRASDTAARRAAADTAARRGIDAPRIH